MFCTTCGNKISDDAKFCTKCGAKVENASKSNNKVISLDCSNSKKKFNYNKNKMLLIGAITSVAIIGIFFVCIMLHSSLSRIHVNYLYNSDETACVTGIEVGKLVEDKEDLHIDIPDTVKKRGKEYSVTSIGDSAFYECSGLKSIEFPDSITSIGDSAFYECSGLKSIEFPDSITSIGDSAFSDCSSLESIEFPDSLTNIGESAFENCIGLTSIEFPSNLTTIGGTSFDEYKEINNPEEMFSEIIDKAFAGCIELEYIGFPNGMDLGLTTTPITDEERYGGFSDSGDEMKYEDEVDSNGYKRSDFVSEQAYRAYLTFGELRGLK